MGTYDGPIKNQDLLNLREYVTADTGSLNKADSTVLLMVTHSNLQARFMEIRFDRYVSGTPTLPVDPDVPGPSWTVIARDLSRRGRVDPTALPFPPRR